MFKSTESSQYIPSKSQAVKPDVVSDILPQDEMRMLLPSFLGFIDPSQSYLRSTIKLSGGRGACVPDPKAGAHALFRNVILRDGSNTATLENVEDYNSMVCMTRPFQEQSTIEHKRQMMEGRQSVATSTKSLYYGAKGDLTGTSSGSPNRTLRTFHEPEVYLRLETGLFSQSKSLPIAVMNGIRLQIDMEEQSRALQLISTSGTELTNTTVEGAVIRPSANFVIDVFKRSGGANEYFSFVTDLDITDLTAQSENPFEIHDRLYVAPQADHASAELQLGVITGFFESAGKLGIEFLTQTNVGVSHPAVLYTAASSVLYVKKSDRVAVGTYFQASDAADVKTGVLTAPSYTMKDMEYRAMTITPPESYTSSLMSQAMSGKGFELQITSPELHRVNQTNATGVSQLQIPSLAKMSKSIIVQPLSITAYRDFTQSSFKGIPDFARDYQWQLGNELVPTRRVPLSRYSQGLDRSEALHLVELQKSLINSEKDVRNLHNVADHFAIGRALNRYKQFTDLSDETVSLRIDYDAGAQQKIFNCYIFKLVDISVEKGIVQVMS